MFEQDKGYSADVDRCVFCKRYEITLEHVMSGKFKVVNARVMFPFEPYTNTLAYFRLVFRSVPRALRANMHRKSPLLQLVKFVIGTYSDVFKLVLKYVATSTAGVPIEQAVRHGNAGKVFVYFQE